MKLVQYWYTNVNGQLRIYVDLVDKREKKNRNVSHPPQFFSLDLSAFIIYYVLLAWYSRQSAVLYRYHFIGANLSSAKHRPRRRQLGNINYTCIIYMHNQIRAII